jgi:hypothetical protein
MKAHLGPNFVEDFVSASWPPVDLPKVIRNPLPVFVECPHCCYVRFQQCFEEMHIGVQPEKNRLRKEVSGTSVVEP